MLPICAWCKRVRDKDDYWQAVELYVSQHYATTFNHGICPKCAKDLHGVSSAIPDPLE